MGRTLLRFAVSIAAGTPPSAASSPAAWSTRRCPCPASGFRSDPDQLDRDRSDRCYPESNL